MLAVKDVISELKASATTNPTAIIISSPLMRKFLNPFNIAVSFSSDVTTLPIATGGCRCP
jgi:hypothetical protein